MHEQQYMFKELGTGLKTTNQATITSATTTQLLAAPTVNGSSSSVNNNYIIYQIDYDLVGDSLTIGDGTAIDGTDRIIFRSLNTGRGTIVYPNGWFCGLNKQVQALTTGASVQCWIRITYTASLPL